ncbi:Crp/Fnr family transcriptional regulator [Siccirubricoccus sp. G192]|uniref:Crp/Fnr family transcriptional regulator n=1 Tax=Siccirubricoccus sp. G192 TaxID=2849651 RepID=UPI001C2BBC5D|nr:Crp/Fnr family transcriptional regulator [Siccirubricoccus sp. G192]MBV1797347.1 Crp/Fnr family transcriptional regulator [Siccirubricoccus sp. G192]
MPTTPTEPSSAPGGRLDPTALQAVPLFADLDRAALADVVQAGRTHRVLKDAALFEQAAPATALHVVLQGRLKVVQAGADGQQIVVRFVGPNDLAGVFALLGPGQVYPATVAAVVDCVVLSWEGPVLQEMQRRYPTLVVNAMRVLGGRSQEVHARLREAATERVERRLALALLRLVRQSGVREEGGAVRIDFPVARQDLAEMAGTTLHTASRILSGWEQAGILAGGRMRIVVQDPHALVRIAEG